MQLIEKYVKADSENPVISLDESEKKILRTMPFNKLRIGNDFAIGQISSPNKNFLLYANGGDSQEFPSVYKRLQINQQIQE
jgi:hypothetical protein